MVPFAILPIPVKTSNPAIPAILANPAIPAIPANLANPAIPTIIANHASLPPLLSSLFLFGSNIPLAFPQHASALQTGTAMSLS